MQIVTYEELYHNTSPDYILEKRLEMVRLAMDIGILKTANFYKCSRNTVKRWLRRYLVYGKKGLKDLSKRPKYSPTKLNTRTINRITNFVKEKNKKSKFISTTNVYRNLDLNCSYVTANKYVKLALGIKKRKPRPKTNGGSLDFKKYLKPFELIQIDIKYLTDIEGLKPYFKSDNDRSLAKYEFTFRDVATGLALVCFGDEKSVSNSEKFLRSFVIPFLQGIPGLNLKDVRIQSDNGKEFTNRDTRVSVKKAPEKSIFTKTVEKYFSSHRTIVPGHCTAQSEVESFHWAIERDCLAWEDIVDNESLLTYVNRYIKNFNNKKRFNKDYSPVEKINEYFGIKIKIPKAIIL